MPAKENGMYAFVQKGDRMPLQLVFSVISLVVSIAVLICVCIVYVKAAN